MVSEGSSASRRTQDRVLALLAVLATAPAWAVLPAALSRRAADFSPFTDQAVLELQVAHATRAFHLLGPYSRFHWNHPGPFFFYLMAPLYALADQASRSVWISVWLVNAACIAGMVWIAGRAAGRVHAALAFVLLVWQTLRLGPENLCDPWGPYVVVLPFELCLVACTAIASGSPGWLPVAVVAASFVVQTNLSAAASTLAALAAGILFGLWRAWRGGHPTEEDATPLQVFMARFGAWASPVILALGAGAVLWAPVVIEQLQSNPGNLTKLADFAANGGRGHTVLEVLRAASDHLAAVLATDPEYRLHASASAVRAPDGLTAGGARLVIVLLPITGVLAAKGKRPWASSGSVVGAVAALAMLVMGRRIEGPLMSYLFLWTAPLGTLAVLLGSGELLERAVPKLRDTLDNPLARRFIPAAAATIAVAAFAWGRTLVLELPYFYGRPSAEIAPLADAVERHLKDERLVRPEMRLGTDDRWGVMAGALLQLYKKRIPFSVEREWRFMFGPQFRSTGPADVHFVFGDAAYEALARDVIGCALIAHAGDTFVYASPGSGAAPGDGAASDPCP